MSKKTKRPYKEIREEFVYVDFEYYNSNERHPELVCAAVQLGNRTPTKHWLHKNDKAKFELSRLLGGCAPHYTMVAHGAAAEARCFQALGLRPTDFQWFCTMAEFRQMQNKNNKYLYGDMIKGGKIITSTPPPWPPKDGYTGYHERVGFDLISTVFSLTRARIDEDQKENMRDVILTGGPYDLCDIEKIMLYCAMDVTYLPSVVVEILQFWRENESLLPGNPRQLLRPFEEHDLPPCHHRLRGLFSACTGMFETEGIPLHAPTLENLQLNYPLIKEAHIAEINQAHPFFLRKLVKKKPQWVMAYKQFSDFIEARGLQSYWPKSAITKKYKMDEETLDDNREIKEIDVLRSGKKSLNQIQWYRPEAQEKLLGAIGSDSHIRGWFGPFGTQTGRNAPPAKTFPLAQSNWLRCLLRPPEGYSITALDYASQEFAVAAVLSGDQNMMEAYLSGDPYAFFAKLVGAMPKDGTKETHPEVRDLFKSTILGLQFRMGVQKLSRKLTHDTGRLVDEDEAREMLNYHQDAFPVYWNWLNVLETQYYLRKRPLATRDMWVLWRDNPSALSTTNFPVQGNAAAILRLAVILTVKKMVTTLASLHDAIYIMHKTNDTEPVELTKTAMQEAVRTTLRGKIDIRIDVKSHASHEVWVEKKGEAMYQKFRPYLESFGYSELLLD